MNQPADPTKQHERHGAGLVEPSHARNGSQWRCVSYVSGRPDCNRDMWHPCCHSKSSVERWVEEIVHALRRRAKAPQLQPKRLPGIPLQWRNEQQIVTCESTTKQRLTRETSHMHLPMCNHPDCQPNPYQRKHVVTAASHDVRAIHAQVFHVGNEEVSW